MKRLLKRWVACSLSLMIMLHSTFLSVSATSEPDWEALGYFPVTITDNNGTYTLNPGDDVYPYFEEDISVTSLGATLGLGQIAGLIAAGAGVVFASQYLDDLGLHLKNALDSAAAAIPNGVDLLAQWTANAVNGDIALASAPSWIAQTILQVMHGLVTSVAPLVSSPFGGYPAPIAGEVVPAGTPIYFGPPYISSAEGTFYRSEYLVFDKDVVPFQFVNLYKSGKYYFLSSTFFLIADGTSSFTAVDHNGTSYTSSSFASASWFTCSSNGLQRYVLNNRHSFGLGYSPSDARLEAYESYIVPGCFTYEGTEAPTISSSVVKSVLESYLSGDVIDGYGAIPEGDVVAPDVLIGGLPDVWVGQGLGADVVTLPDINLDGSDLINVGDQTVLDTSIGTTMDKLATGELTWDDYWLDISGSGPLVDVGEGEGEDVGPPLQLPDWFKDWCKDITGTELDRNSEIDSMLPDLDEGMGQIDDFSASIGDQLKTEFDSLHIENFALSTSVLLAIGWIAGWVTQFFNASGEAQVVVLLPMFIGLALLFIGRGSVAMSRVHASHQHDTRKSAVSGKKGVGTP